MTNNRLNALIGWALLTIATVVAIVFLNQENSVSDSGKSTIQHVDDKPFAIMLAEADANWTKGDLSTAQTLYQSVSSQSKDPEIRFNAALGLARVCRAQKLYAEALEKLDDWKGSENESQQVRIHMARAEVFFEMENYERALEEIKWILGKNPEFPDAVILRGKIHFKTKFDGKAIDEDWVTEIRNHEIGLGDPLLVNFHAASLKSNEGMECAIQSNLGDRENFIVFPDDADQGKYRIRIATLQGNPSAGDNQLQTQVGDTITLIVKLPNDGYTHRQEVKVVEAK